jgi:hypothetical protein
MHDNTLVSLVLVGLELDCNVGQLTTQLSSDDVILDSIGMRCITRERARALFTQRDAARAEQARRQAEFEAHMAELDQRNRAQRIVGRPAVSGNAYLDMVAGDQQ